MFCHKNSIRLLSRNFSSKTMTLTEQLSSLETYLALREISKDTYQNASQLRVPYGGRGLFGGTLAAQSVLSSLLSVNTPEKKWKPLSLHCFFFQAALPNSPLTYKVVHLKSGKNYQTKEILLEQDGVLKFKAICSLQALQLQGSAANMEGQLNHQPLAPVIGKDIMPPQEMEDQMEVFKLWAHKSKGNPKFKNIEETLAKVTESYDLEPCRWKLPADMFDLDLVTPKERNALASDRCIRYWVQTKEEMVDPEVFSWVALAYISDYFYLSANMRLNMHCMFTSKFSVSLDHTIYFHKEIDPSHWFSHNVRTIRAGENRSLISGQMFSQNGDLAVTTFQEGMSVIHTRTNAKL